MRKFTIIIFLLFNVAFIGCEDKKYEERIAKLEYQLKTIREKLDYVKSSAQ